MPRLCYLKCDGCPATSPGRHETAESAVAAALMAGWEVRLVDQYAHFCPNCAGPAPLVNIVLPFTPHTPAIDLLTWD